MSQLQYKELLEAGVHFGHLTSKWHPKMAPYIFMEKNDIHIIDLNKTIEGLDAACNFVRSLSKSGKKVMFVATKKQAQEVIEAHAQNLKMPYVIQRWLGGMLTNFATVRKSLKKMTSIDRLSKEEAYSTLNKKEKLMMTRERTKLQLLFGGIADQTRLPAALFIVDVKKEHIAIAEAMRLGIPVIGMVDTNSDPTNVDFPIPANDDALKSISIITGAIAKAIQEGLNDRKNDKDNFDKEQTEEVAEKAAPVAEISE